MPHARPSRPRPPAPRPVPCPQVPNLTAAQLNLRKSAPVRQLDEGEPAVDKAVVDSYLASLRAAQGTVRAARRAALCGCTMQPARVPH